MEFGVMNIWLLTTGTLLAGISIGAVGLAAVERHFRMAKTAGSIPDQVEVAQQQIPPARNDHDRRGVETSAPERNSGGNADRTDTVNEALSALGQRVTELEAQMLEVFDKLGSAKTLSAEPARVASRGLDQETLLAAGVEPGLASAYLSSQSRLEMQRLELRDRASREGWLNSDRFRKQLGELEGSVEALRAQIGDDSYDRFLYLTGQPNRVVIASVIEESPAQLAGVQAGDIVLDYADSRVFSFTELRDATRVGESGESVLVRVQRKGETLELLVPRGPLGVRLDSERVEPADNR
jgi:hypothetical protein